MDTEHLKPLVNIDQASIGQLFVGYLNSEHIPAKLVAHQGSFIVMVDVYHHQQAIILFEEFITQPYHPKYQEAAWANAKANDMPVIESPLQGLSKRFFSHAGLVTLSIFALCWIVFLYGFILGGRELYNTLSFYYTLSTSAFLEAPYKLLGPAFIHFSWLHIVFNTMWWWQLGGEVERAFSKQTLINVFLIAAISANVGQYLITGPNFGGLSGVVYALVGFVWWSGWLMPHKGIHLSKPIVGFMLFWLLLGFVDALPVNMANTAHVMGLISGCLCAWFIAKIKHN